jgi:hypothetical protein
LRLDPAQPPSPFIITTLKEAYDGILGMPWIKKHGHLIDWKARRFSTNYPRIAAADAASSSPPNAPHGTWGKARMMDKGVCVLDTLAPPQCKHNLLPSRMHPELAGQQDPLLQFEQTQTINPRTPDPRPIATAVAVLSDPKNPSSVGMARRHARLTDEGVCVSHALALPQCESDSLPLILCTKSAGKPVPSLEQENWTNINAAKASWSTSAQLVAKSKMTATPQPVKQIVPQVYHRFLEMFKKTGAQSLPPRQKYDFRVELIPGAQPQASRIIPLLPAEHQVLDTMISEGLANGTIQQTTSLWAAPVLFTGKKDGNLRPCFDYHKLNAVTVKNRYPLPLKMDLINSLLNADTFTKLDLRNAYGNLRVAEGDKDKLAFICHAGQFAPLTMPFGPTGAPGFFQYFIQDILLGRIGKDVAAYLDDIMIYTQKGSDHQAAVNSVLETLSNHQLWLKPEKCEFSRKEVEYLGLLISCNRLKMDPAKVKTVTEWPAPKNVTKLQRFIGFANFYRRFIDHFSGMTQPLHDLTKDRTPFNWDEVCNTAFKALKTAFTTAPILKIANPYSLFILECNCPDFALGAVLSQVCEKDQELHPVAYLSRSLIKSEQNYEIFDKELLAIVASFKEWRHYLEGNPHRLKAIV